MGRVGADELLEAERDEAGEEEAGEGEHVEGHQVGLGAVPSRAGVPRARVGAVGQPRTVGGGPPRQAQEGGQREERVHVHDAVQRRDVDAGSPAPAAPAAAATPRRDVAAVHAALLLAASLDWIGEETEVSLGIGLALPSTKKRVVGWSVSTCAHMTDTDQPQVREWVGAACRHCESWAYLVVFFYFVIVVFSYVFDKYYLIMY